ncbi:sensor histidine kinase [Alteribacillus sp. HJP-4]|uniref:sensor histidine kinase n=1 Tax=Alteribacillus sp. HJP-4 TaxID=2775394 RepID=UPI0035CD11AB
MRNWMYRLNIQQRLLLYFTIVILVSITLVTWLIYQQTTKEIKDQSEANLEYIVENANYQTDLFVKDLEYATLPILTENRVKSFLELEEEERLSQYYHTKDIKKMMKSFELRNQNINLIYLLGENGQAVFSENNFFQDEDSYYAKDIYERLLETTPESGKVSLLGSESIYNNEYVVSITRRMRGFSFVPKGILGVEINASALEQLWNIAQFENGTSLWIFDEYNRIVYHPEQKWVGKPLDNQLKKNISSNTNGTFTADWEEEEMLFYYDRSPNTNWTLVAMKPKEAVYEPVSGMNKTAIIAIGSSILIALLISIVFAKSIVKPLRKVQTGMKKMEVGEWEIIKPLKGTDEISSVVSSYNKMIKRLSALVDDLYAAEVKNHTVMYEKQNIELQALQSQINPHFLHNTLETMNGYAILNDADEISEMASALSQMFRYSVRNLEIVTLEEELSHVKNFLIVEEHRFQKSFQIDLDIPSLLQKEEIVKLSLQPLVENAIHHGLRKKRYEGEITIRARKEDSCLMVEVIDNGTGISQEKLAEIQSILNEKDGERRSEKMGIGLWNVNRRIQLIFDENSGLEVLSNDGEGTTIRMKIPRKDLSNQSVS